MLSNIWLNQIFFSTLRSTFRPTFAKIDLITNLFPSVPVLALTGTAIRDTKYEINSTSGLSKPVVVECNPNRHNTFYASHVRTDRGENKLHEILDPIVSELKLEKLNMPLTLIYGNLETISDWFLYFAKEMGKEQYFPTSAEPLARNRLIS